MDEFGEPVTPNAWMTFGFNEDDMPDDADIEFAAILYDDELCQGNIIGRTTENNALRNAAPLLSTDYTGSPPAKDVLDRIKLEIVETDTNDPKLNIYAHPKTFFLPYYTQDQQCSDDVGETDENEYNNDETSRCGVFTGCVEFQVLHCGDKADLVDVLMVIEFDLLEDCEDDFCGELKLFRAPRLADGEDTNIGQLFCYPCDREDAVTPLKVSQGTAVLLCLDVSNCDVAWFFYVNMFVFVVICDELAHSSTLPCTDYSRYFGCLRLQYRITHARRPSDQLSSVELFHYPPTRFETHHGRRGSQPGLQASH